MLEIHTQENGVSMLIAEMDDDHLTNTIQMLCTKIQLLGEIISTKNVEFENPIVQALMPKLDTANIQKQAKEKLQSFDQIIKPYVHEAALRGLDVSKMLQDAYQRKTALPSRTKAILKLLNQSIKQSLKDYENEVIDMDDNY